MDNFSDETKITKKPDFTESVKKVGEIFSDRWLVLDLKIWFEVALGSLSASRKFDDLSKSQMKKKTVL